MEISNFNQISRKSIVLTVVTGLLIFLIVVFFYRLSEKINAQDSQDVNTSVSVDNNAPSFTTVPYEEDDDTSNASTNTTPTNEGDPVNMHATGTDQDGDQYYLIVCSTDSASAGDDTAPTCGGTQYCVSSATDSDSAATCDITTTGLSSESYAWWGFVCDKIVGTGDCSSSSQGGGGDNGTPFIVNHAPSFTALADDSDPYDPGHTITWTSTASDTDTNEATDDDLYLLVCVTAGTSQTNPYTAPTCDGGGGDTYGLSTGGEILVTNPVAHYDIPDPTAHGTPTAYGYVYDQHYELESSGQTETFTVSDITPIITIDTVPGAITLSEGTTSNEQVEVTISDDNGYDDVVTGGGVVLDFYGDWLAGGHADCDEAGEIDGDDCYRDATCSYDSDGSGKTAGYTCTVSMQYYAESTGTVDSQHETNNWEAYNTVTDSGSNTGTDNDATSDVNLLVAFSSGTSIAYGSVSAGDQSTNQTVTVTNHGNSRLNTNLKSTASGGSANMCVDYPTCATGSGQTPIAVVNQHYDTSSITWPGGTGLTSSDVLLALNVAKTTSTGVENEDIYWMLNIPAATISGSYTGSNTITAIQWAGF